MSGSFWILGYDCAVQDKNSGLALGRERALRRKRKVLRGLSRGARGGCGCPAGAASRCVQIQDNPIDPRLRLEKVHLTSQNELQKCAAGVAGEVARLAEIEVHPRLHVFR